MKKILFTGWFLFVFCFSGFGQVDTAAVVREVDSLIQESRILTEKRDFSSAMEINATAENLTLGYLGKETIEYGKICTNYGNIMYFKGDYGGAKKWFLESGTIHEKLLGKEHAEYAQCLNNLGNLYWRTGENLKAEELYLETKSIREKSLGKEHPDYAKSLNNLGNIYMALGKYELVEPYYLEARDVWKKTVGIEHSDYAKCLHNLANFYSTLGKYEKAEPLYLEAKTIREKVFGMEHLEYTKNVDQLAILYWRMGNYEKAESYALEAIRIKGKILGYQHPEYANSLSNLGIVYEAMGKYEEAVSLYCEGRSIIESSMKKESPGYASWLHNLANVYWKMGEYEKAEPLALEAKAIREKTIGTKHPDYARSLTNLALLYESMSNYLKAEPFYLESKIIIENKFGNEHPGYALCLNNLASLYGNMGNYKKAEPYYLESKTIKDKTLGVEHPDYALSVSNLALLYFKMGAYKKAEPLFLESKTILEKALQEEHPDYAFCLENLALLYSTIGKYEQAELLYLKSKDIYEKKLGRQDFKYVRILHNLASLYLTTNKFDAAKSTILEASKIQKSLLIRGTRHLSEQEMAAYQTKFSKTLNQDFSLAKSQLEISAECYENAVFYKGFLLVTAAQTRKLLLTDSLSTVKYNLLKSYHRRLAAEYTKPIADRKNVAELEEKANTLEKDLARTVSGFGEALRQVTWPEVQTALRPGEAAIEFIRFNYFNPEPTDSVLYAALVLKPGMSTPAFITLFEEKQLDALLDSLAGQGSAGLNNLYGNKAGQALYRLLWAPLEPHLKGIKTVYHSPAGLLHRLNLGAIPTGESKETIGKRYTLSTLGSTRQLVVPPTSATTTATAAIFGGIRYDMDSTTAIATIEPEQVAGSRGLSFSQTDSTLRSGSWKYLKYSDKEADNIQAQLQKAGFQASVHKGYAATEEAFKQLGKDQPSPRILHVSTHGFFFPDPGPTPHSPEFSGQAAIPTPHSEDPVFKISDHPMIRSGLILAGANHAWTTGKPLGNREDGILTAYEISQMDLRHTELVVLSACETGLGDIRGNEGVYGLQRAFKIAGARNLIMSLWQVPDFQTQELMTVFYQKWLDEKLTVRQSLTAAQEEMQRRRYEPFYWAGFVLVE